MLRCPRPRPRHLAPLRCASLHPPSLRSGSARRPNALRPAQHKSFLLPNWASKIHEKLIAQHIVIEIVSHLPANLCLQPAFLACAAQIVIFWLAMLSYDWHNVFQIIIILPNPLAVLHVERNIRKRQDVINLNFPHIALQNIFPACIIKHLPAAADNAAFVAPVIALLVR